MTLAFEQGTGPDPLDPGLDHRSRHLQAVSLDGVIEVDNNDGHTDDHSQEFGEPNSDQIAITRCGLTESEEVTTKARQLTASKYLRRGFIQPHEVNGGIIEADPAHDHSLYYVNWNEMSDGDTQVIAVLRKTYYDENLGSGSFPVLDHQEKLNPVALAKIEQVGIENCVEIGTLVKDSKLDVDNDAALKLYRSLFQDSLRNGAEDPNTIYLMAANPRLYRMFKVAFNGYLKRMGPDLDYPGQEAVPAMIQPRAAIIDALQRMTSKRLRNPMVKRSVRYMLDGLDETNLAPDVAEALQAAREAGAIAPARATGEGIDAEYENAFHGRSFRIPSLPKWREILRHRRPEMVAAAGLVGYTALRTYGVAQGVSPSTDVNWKTFLGIEIATTWPYVAGMGDIARSIANPGSYSRNRKIGAAAVAGASFMAPYAYVVANGEGMPASSWTGVGAVLGVSAISAVKRLINVRRSKKTDAELHENASQPE